MRSDRSSAAVSLARSTITATVLERKKLHHSSIVAV